MTIPNPCEELVKQYLEQLQGMFATIPSDNGCFVVTPFTRPDGESVEVALELQPDGRFRLTDMGDTLGYLYVHGLTLSRSIVDSTKGICRQFSASLEGAEIVIQMDNPQGLGEALHRLTQTVFSVTDLIQKRRPMERVNFDGEVESLIILSGVVYDTDYGVRGRRSMHPVRFHVNSNRNLLVKPLSPASEPAAFSWAERWAYRFNDILEQDRKWHCMAVLDDRGERARIWSDRALAPLQDFTVLWTKRGRLSDMLSQ